MLKKLILNNWKSFQQAELDIEFLTVLIGANSSGKSNAIDALDFLKLTAQGKDLQSALSGDQQIGGVRGGIEWASLKPNDSFELQVLVGTNDDSVDYLYIIKVLTIPHVQLIAESLDRITKPSRSIHLFLTDTVSAENPSIRTRLYNRKQGARKNMLRSSSILSQLKNSTTIRKEIADGIAIVAKVLGDIFILDPIPSQMRNYSPLSDHIYSDGSNIAGVLAALKDDKKTEIEALISSYITKLPEKDICRVWAEPVGKFKYDAMLYCEEIWSKEQPPITIDARAMSDGTLRFLAIITALLTRPKGSQIIIEEVDNGLHPSRSHLLLKMLKEISEKRQIDILVTTHNPALLDELDLEFIPTVIVAHRNSDTGYSQLTRLADLNNLPKLMASGSLGKITAQGLLEKSLSRSN